MIKHAAGEPRRRPRASDQREALRRVTIGAAAGATLLNGFLFVETGLAQLGPGALQDAIASTINAFLPGAGLQPAAEGPRPAPGATPVAVSGGS